MGTKQSSAANFPRLPSSKVQLGTLRGREPVGFIILPVLRFAMTTGTKHPGLHRIATSRSGAEILNGLDIATDVLICLHAERHLELCEWFEVHGAA
jgi:hypothetical protein